MDASHASLAAMLIAVAAQVMFAVFIHYREAKREVTPLRGTPGPKHQRPRRALHTSTTAQVTKLTKAGKMAEDSSAVGMMPGRSPAEAGDGDGSHANLTGRLHAVKPGHADQVQDRSDHCREGTQRGFRCVPVDYLLRPSTAIEVLYDVD